MMRMIGIISRLLPDFKGKRRMIRFLLGKHLNATRNVEIIGKYDCRYLVPNLFESIGFELFVNGVFEDEVIRFILEQLPEHGIFLDLGSNIGAVSLPVCKMRPGARVISVEASPFVLPYLKENISKNNVSNCKIYEFVISDIEDQMISFYYPTEQFGKGSVANLYGSSFREIPSVTIDEIMIIENLDRVDFIKMDVEGYEYFALKGGRQLLSRPDAPPILFEFIDYAEMSVPGLTIGDAQRLVIDFGYDIFHFDNGKMIPLDAPLEHGFAIILAFKKHAS